MRARRSAVCRNIFAFRMAFVTWVYVVVGRVTSILSKCVLIYLDSVANHGSPLRALSFRFALRDLACSFESGLESLP